MKAFICYNKYIEAFITSHYDKHIKAYRLYY
jgi:hypothetical protein